MCRLRRVEPDDGGRIRRTHAVLRGGLPGLLQAECAACQYDTQEQEFVITAQLE